MPPSLKATGAWAELTADGAVTVPGTPVAGDRKFVFAVWKAFGTTAQIVSPQGWYEVTEFTDGAVAAGANVGSVKVGCWVRDHVAGDGNPTLDFSVSPAPAFVVAQVWEKDASEAWDVPTFVTAAISAADPFSATSSATLTVKDGAAVFCLVGLRDDSSTWTRDSNTALDDDGSPAVTWNGNVVESPATHGSTTTSNDLAADLVHRLVTTGAAGVNLTTTGDPAAAETGAALWVHQGVSANSAYAAAVVALSPIFYWRLGEPSGTTAWGIRGPHLTYINTPTLGATGLISGDADTAVTFARASSELANDPTSQNPAGGSAGATVVVWAALGSFSGTESHWFLVWNGISATQNNHQFYFDANSSTTVGKLQWQFNDGVSQRTITSATFTPGSTVHMFSARHDYAAETITFGIDGVEQAVSSAAFGVPIAVPLNAAGNGAVGFGGYTAGTGDLNGTLDEVAVFPSVLTAGDIADLYALGSGAAATDADAGLASGTGAAANSAASVKPTGGAATATGAANNAAPSVKPNAAAATGTGTANNATTLLASNASAGAATGTGAGANVAAKVAPNAGIGTGTGLANNATVSVATATNAAAGVAAGTGAAANVSASIKPTAGQATGTGLANNPAASIKPTASTATGTGAALNATASTVSTASAAAGVATGTGVAANVTTAIKASASTATGTGTASGAMGSDQASAIIATGTGTAHDATASTLAFRDADAGTASGTGLALDPNVAIKVNAGHASGTGVANNPFALVPGATIATAGVATGTGTAHNATASDSVVVPGPVPPAGSTGGYFAVSPGPKPKPRPEPKPTPKLVYAYAQVATGKGTAFNAKIEWNDDETALSLLLDLEAA